MSKDVQNSLLEAINIMVSQNINNMQYTSSNTGIVKSVGAFDCMVEINGEEYKCSLMEHLHDWIQEDDIVIIQDLYNNGLKRMVLGKVGTTRPTSFTVYDTEKGRAISGVEMLVDDETDTVLKDIILYTDEE